MKKYTFFILLLFITFLSFSRQSYALTVTSNFSATPTDFCTYPATVQFTNLSTNATTYLWDFGDGSTSTAISPSHIYNSLGNFTVTLIAYGGANGNDTLIMTAYIKVGHTMPSVTSDTICDQGSTTLTASGTGVFSWYNVSTGGTALQTGTSYTTPTLTTTTTYYVESTVYDPSVYVGPTNNTTNGNQYTQNASQYLIFTCYQPCKLISVSVNSQYTGNRTIQLQNSSGTVLQTKTVNIPSGVSRVTLNFDIPAGTNLRLVGPAYPYLYRSNSGCNYPYTLSGILSITSSSATTNPTSYYYYFYDWEVQEKCISARTPATVTVAPTTTAGVSISTSSTSVCAGQNVIFTATPVNGGTPSYQWKRNGTIVGTNSATYSTSSLTNNDVISCVMTSSAACVIGNPATSNSITMTVNPVFPVSVNIAANNNNICAGQNVTFTPTPVNGGTSPIYQWYVSGTNNGAGSSFSSSLLNNNDIVTCVLTSSLTCTTNSPATSNSITMTVNPIMPVSVSIASNQGDLYYICTGTNVIFTATPTNGGTPNYYWIINGGIVGTGNTYSSSTLNDNDVISCVLNSSLSCTSGSPATSNAITMAVASSYTPSINISPTNDTICSGQTIVFSANAVCGGASPQYQWQLNGSNIGNSSTFTSSTLSNNDVINCYLTSSVSCAINNPANSNIVNVVVNQNLPVSISISESANNICYGTNVIFTPNPVNGGLIPVYQWKVNNSNIGNSSTFSSSGLNNNDIVTCTLTSSETCTTGNTANSNPITMNVIPNLPVSISITIQPNNYICVGTNVTFNSTIINGGLSPIYQWEVNGSLVSNSTSYSNSSLNNSDVVTCTLISSENCTSSNPATSNSIVMNVSQILPVSINIISNSGDSICTGENASFTAFPTNGGSYPIYQWQVNGSNSGTGNTFNSLTLNDNDMISCILISSEYCTSGNPAPSNYITMIVNPNLPVSVSIYANTGDTICSGTNVLFNAVATNGGTNPQYQWEINGLNVAIGNTYQSSMLNNNDIITCQLISSHNCVINNPASSNIINMVVNTSLNAGISVSALTNLICSGDTVIFIANSTNEGINPNYQWKINGTDIGTNIDTLVATSLNNNDVINCLLTSSENCIINNPVISNPIYMNVTYNPIASFSFAANSSFVNFTNTSANANSYLWDLGDGGISTQVNPSYYYAVSGLYTVSLIASNSCGSDTAYQDVDGIATKIYNSEFTDNIILFPNPTNGLITIKSINNKIFKVKILDISGRLLIESDFIDEQSTFDLTTFESGIYLMKIYIDSKIYVQKVVLNK